MIEFDARMSSKNNERTPYVTIGICVKDSERTIKAAILSVLSQTFEKKCMEIIVVDDGSQDKTLSIITELLSKAKIKVKVIPTRGVGLTVARQMVVDSSAGNFVLFVDGDMVLPKDFVQSQFAAINSNPLVGGVGARTKARLNRSVLAELESISLSSNYEIAINRNWRQNPQILGTGGSIFRVAAIKKAGGFDTRIKGAAEDADISAKIKLAGYRIFISQSEFEHEFKQTLKGLWKQYAWYGYGVHYFRHKHKRGSRLMLTHFWPISFGTGVFRSVMYFKTTRRKSALQLPFFQFFKATAWWFGFFKAHQEGYGHGYRYAGRKE
jgi:cellulose synthase/poly-beta-1,6-N-acetylglucosamine synthase-like glycosyltransferase